MVYSSLIDDIASKDLQILVRRADEQQVEGQVACFCPFCKQQTVGVRDGLVRENVRGSETPHFIIYKDRFGGLYGCNDGKGAQKWMCTRTRKQGYGLLELWCAMEGYGMEGEDLRRALIGTAKDGGALGKSQGNGGTNAKGAVAPVAKDGGNGTAKGGGMGSTAKDGGANGRRGLLDVLCVDKAQFEKGGLYEDENPYRYDFRGVAKRPTDKFLFQYHADYRPDELRALGCEVKPQGDGFEYSFGKDFSPNDIKADFRTRPLQSATLPAVQRNGEAVSEVIYGTPWNPLFITFATKDSDCGCIWRPAMQREPIVFSNNPELTVARVSKWLMGDKVFMYAVEHRDSKTTAVAKAIRELDPDEQVVEEREEWQEQTDRDTGEPNGKFRLMTEPIQTEQIKARDIVFFDSPQDAIASYYLLRAYRESQPENETLQRLCWYHTAFMAGKAQFWYMEHGEWKHSKVEFGTVQHRKLTRFADKVAILYPNTRQEQRTACSIARKFRDMALGLLPDEFHNPRRQTVSYIYGHKPCTVRDFILTYKMGDEEAFKYDRNFLKRFHAVMKKALPTAPLQQQQKRDRNNAVKETFYTVNPATVWLFMMCEGYFRAVDPMSEDKVGQYIHRQGPFVEPVTKESMVAATQDCLRRYAEENSRDNHDYELMLTGIARSGKEINTNTITALPATTLNYNFNTATETYAFYRNGALKVTPTERRMVQYSSLPFDIDPRAVIQKDYYPGQWRLPYFEENPLMQDMRNELALMRQKKDDNGKPMYRDEDFSRKEEEIEDVANHRQFILRMQCKDERSLQPVIRMVRGMSNTHWAEERQDLEQGTPSRQDMVEDEDMRFACMMHNIGVLCHGYHGDEANVAPYLMEDSVLNEKEASGGSGKSSVINLIVACFRKVYTIDCKTLNPQDMRFVFGNYVPHVFGVVHFEDAPRNFDIKQVYNVVTGGMQLERKHDPDVKRLSLNDTPMVAISSNYPPSDTDDSTERRLVRVPFSNRYRGKNIITGTTARKPTDTWKGFTNLGVDALSNHDFSMCVDLCAMAVQFRMQYPFAVNAPSENTKRRSLVKKFTEAFVNFAEYFFSREDNYAHVVDLKSAFYEFLYDYASTSEDNLSKFKLSTFRDKMQDWCASHQIIMNPKHLYGTNRQEKLGYYKLTMWITNYYFYEKEFENVEDVTPKRIRKQRNDRETGVIFFRPTDKIPEDYKALQQLQKTYMSKPDPSPFLDDDGNPVTLTDVEQQYVDGHIKRKTGGKQYIPTQAPATAQTAYDQGTDPSGNPLPF